MKHVRSVLSLLTILSLQACCEFCESDQLLCEDGLLIRARILSGNRDVAGSYIHGYGIGKENSLFFPLRSWSAAYSNISDSCFLLPLDVNRDTSAFCLVNADLSIDTVEIVYQRKFNAHRSCGYMFTIGQPRVSHVSHQINPDSTKFTSEVRYSRPEKYLLIKIK
jgi:hypothetical protein